MFSTSLISTTLEFILLFGLSCVFYGSLLCHCFICVFFIGVSQLSQSCLHVVLSFCLSSHVSPSLSLPPCFSLRPSPSCSCVCFISLTCSHVLVLVFHPLSLQSIMCVCYCQSFLCSIVKCTCPCLGLSLHSTSSFYFHDTLSHLHCVQFASAVSLCLISSCCAPMCFHFPYHPFV